MPPVQHPALSRFARIALPAVMAWLLTFPADAIASGALWARSDFPIPPETPERLFFVQRSMNANTVVYDVRLQEDGRVHATAPVHAYWLRYQGSGERRELGYFERAFGYGPIARRSDGSREAWTIHVAGYSARTATLQRDSRGRLSLVGTVNGRAARLVSAYLHVESGGLLPRVTHAVLYGVDLATGTALQERIVP